MTTKKLLYQYLAKFLTKNEWIKDKPNESLPLITPTHVLSYILHILKRVRDEKLVKITSKVKRKPAEIQTK